MKIVIGLCILACIFSFIYIAVSNGKKDEQIKRLKEEIKKYAKEKEEANKIKNNTNKLDNGTVRKRLRKIANKK